MIPLVLLVHLYIAQLDMILSAKYDNMSYIWIKQSNEILKIYIIPRQ